MIVDNTELVDLEDYATPYNVISPLTDEEKEKAESEHPDDMPF